MIIEIKITGIPETISSIKGFRERLIRNSVRRAVRAALVPTRTAARLALAPHAFSRSGAQARRAGDLSRSMHISTRINRALGSISSKLSHRKETFYGRYLELGTRHQPPLRWLGRSFDATKRLALSAFIANLNKSIQTLARGD